MKDIYVDESWVGICMSVVESNKYERRDVYTDERDDGERGEIGNSVRKDDEEEREVMIAWPNLDEKNDDDDEDVEEDDEAEDDDVEDMLLGDNKLVLSFFFPIFIPTYI